MLDALKDWLTSLMTASFKGFDLVVQKSAEVLSGGLSNWVSVSALAEYLRPFCYTIIAICLMIELAQVAAKVDVMKWEIGLKLCVKMVLAKVCIDIAPTFLEACYKQAQEWIGNLISGSSTMGALASEYLEGMINNVEGFGNVLGLFLSTFIVLLAVMICSLIIQVIAYGRMFEIYVYLVVSPLPCAFMPLGTGDGGGVSRITSRFFKSFIAVCFQGVMMVVVMRVFDVVIGGAVMNAIEAAAAGGDPNAAITDLVFAMLLGAIALVMAVVKCGSWAKSLLDAA